MDKLKVAIADDNENMLEILGDVIGSEEDLNLLRTYYEQGMSLAKTCEILFLHKNTLQYKLDRIHRLSGYNPREFRHGVILYVALWLNVNLL